MVYNPMGNEPVSVVFSEPRTCVATGQTTTEHQLQSPDGGIYLRTDSLTAGRPRTNDSPRLSVIAGNSGHRRMGRDLHIEQYRLAIR